MGMDGTSNGYASLKHKFTVPMKDAGWNWTLLSQIQFVGSSPCTRGTGAILQARGTSGMSCYKPEVHQGCLLLENSCTGPVASASLYPPGRGWGHCWGPCSGWGGCWWCYWCFPPESGSHPCPLPADSEAKHWIYNRTFYTLWN